MTIPDLGETTCVDVVANFLVVSDFVTQYNYKFVYEINRAIPKISDLNNFITTSVLCWWAEGRQDTIVSVKIGSLASPLLPSIICLGSQRLFFEIVSVIDTFALTSRLFRKYLNCFFFCCCCCFCPIRNIFDWFDYLFIESNCFIGGSGKIVNIKWINYKIS